MIDARAVAGPPAQYRPGLWHEAARDILGSQASLDRVPCESHHVLRRLKAKTCGDVQLPGHQVIARHGFRDRMLDLKACVHLHEVELAVLRQQALDRASPYVTDRAGGTNRHLA